MRYALSFRCAKVEIVAYVLNLSLYTRNITETLRSHKKVIVHNTDTHVTVIWNQFRILIMYAK